MSDYKLQSSRFHKVLEFSATGVIAISGGHNLYGEETLSMVVEGVGSANKIRVSGRLKGATGYITLINLHGTIPATIDVSNYDNLKFEVVAYSASGSPKLIANSYYTKRQTSDTMLLDEVSSTVSYLGYSPLGAATSTDNWKIKRILVSGTLTSTQFADGNENYDNIWDNRASLTYI